MIGMGVTEIERLSQKEGLTDNEIAMLFGVHRTTVARVRATHNIPKYNPLMKKDKVCYCRRCHQRFIIRRGEIRHLCYECVPLVDGKDTIVEEAKAWANKRNKNNKNSNQSKDNSNN